MEKKVMTHASLFSGIGGPELAAQWLGWKNLFHCEINPFGRQVLNYWFNKSESYENIKTTDFTKWRGRVDVLTGGFPCQPFSYAGKRRGADDDRYLWPEMLRAIDEIRPTWVVGENVAGIATMVEPGEIVKMGDETSLFGESENYVNERGRFTIERICKDLENHGYSVQPVLVPACAVGAPHRRDRIFIIGRIVNVNKRDAAADSESRDAVGKAGDLACAGGKERIQERHGIHQPCSTGAVRPESEGIVKDSVSDGCTDGKFNIVGHEELHGKSRTAGEDGQAGLAVADTDHAGDTSSVRSGGQEWKEMDCIGEGITQPIACGFGSKSIASDSCVSRLERCGRFGIQKDERGTDRILFKFASRCYVKYNKSGLGRWDYFPSVPAVYRGNDGLPFDVSRLAIPFNKWRNEAIKSCGNAIVPQVMYEIFRAIQIAETSDTEF